MAIRGKNEKELLSEFISKNRVVNCISQFGWERQFQHAFTHEMFKLIQEQIKRLWYCDVNPPNDDEESNEHGTERYNILERCIINDWYHMEFAYRVKQKENGQYFSCNCKKFDSSRILCCHILKVIVAKGIEKMEYVKRQLRALQVNLSEWNDGLLASAIGSENVSIANSDSSVAVLNPNEARSRGRPRSNRFQSRHELNGGSNRSKTRGRRGRRGCGTRVAGGGRTTNFVIQNNID
ncbi:uncharacterized protein LOC131177899 [Hevea brasiliensis]|uniref:uncharacterized protein LOC131177899 n=1 Tax=Hevea brasiliensis TaxID=3981 RepID=UPI0025D606B4|nr:uncharacterized protein LOC131177899 [Hevea brasiliensis]